MLGGPSGSASTRPTCAPLDGLPVAGVTGTLANRFDRAGRPPAAGSCAQDRHDPGRNTLAGYAVTADGHPLVRVPRQRRATSARACGRIDASAALAACGCGS